MAINYLGGGNSTRGSFSGSLTGNNLELQFNNGGALSGVPNFIYDQDNSILRLPPSTSVQTGGQGILFGQSSISRGSFDSGFGGDSGISLNCAVGYELNWQAGQLSTYQGITNTPITLGSSLRFNTDTLVLDSNYSPAIVVNTRVLVNDTATVTVDWLNELKLNGVKFLSGLGTPNYTVIADANGDMVWTPRVAGSNGSLQYNNNDTLGAVPGVSYDGTRLNFDSLSIGGNTVVDTDIYGQLRFRQSGEFFTRFEGAGFSDISVIDTVTSKFLEMFVTGNRTYLQTSNGADLTLRYSFQDSLTITDGKTVNLVPHVQANYANTGALPSASTIGAGGLAYVTGGGFYGTNGSTWSVLGGGGSPGGDSGQLQYNNGGVFGGVPGATWNGTTLNLPIPLVINGLTYTSPYSDVTRVTSNGDFHEIEYVSGTTDGFNLSLYDNSLDGLRFGKISNRSFMQSVGLERLEISNSSNTINVYSDRTVFSRLTVHANYGSLGGLPAASTTGAGGLAYVTNVGPVSSNGTRWTALLPTEVTLTSTAGAVSVDAGLGSLFNLTLTQNSTMNFPTNLASGTYIFTVTQGSSAYTVTWNASYKWPGGVAPTQTTANGTVDIYSCVFSGGVLRCSAVQAFV